MNISYPYMPEGRVIKYAPSEHPFMQEAAKARRELSTDRQHPTGVVLVKEGRVIARAGNQSALKNPKLLELHRRGWCMRRLLKIPSGEKYWLCAGCASSKNHAETLAVADALQRGVDPSGADIYLYGHWWCCKPCWDSMIAAGIRDVYLLKESERLFNKTHPNNIISK